MPRAIWSGSVSFGLVSIPVKLFSAVSRKTVHFNQLDEESGSRIRQKRVSAATGEEVPYEQIVKGYELPSGEYVRVSDDELAALDPKANRTIEILEFVDLVDIDPVYYDSAYYLAPDPATAKPYKLLTEAMEEAGKVALARFVMRTKEYLAAIRPVDGRMLLSTMVYADEVVDPGEISTFDALDDIDVTKKERAMATSLIDSLTEDFDATRHEDGYRKAVLALIERKASGDTDLVAAPVDDGDDTVVDLMAALEASVSAAKEARGRHPAAKKGDAAADDEGSKPKRTRKSA